MKKNLAIGVVVVLTVFLSILIINGHKPTTSSESTADELIKVSVRMKWFFAGTMAGWFTGKEQGIFLRHGIDLTINPGGPDNNSIKLIAAGTDLFGVAGADEVLLARAKGIPVVAIGVLFKESPVCFISKVQENIKTPADWAGKTVEVSYGSNAETEYRALVAKFNVHNIKEVPYSFNLVPFIEDKVDVSVAYRMDQVVTLQRKGITLSIITPKEYGINPYGDVVITTEATLRDRRDLVRRFMAAVVESQQWAVENPDAAVNDLVAAAGNLKAGNERAVWAATIPFLTTPGGEAAIGRMLPERWQETRQVMVEYGGLPSESRIQGAYQDVLPEQK